MITDPLVGHIVQVNKSVIEKTADGTDGYEDASMISVSLKLLKTCVEKYII